MRNSVLMIAISGVLLLSGCDNTPRQYFGGVEVVVVKSVDRGKVEGGSRLLARYDYVEDKVYIIKKPWSMRSSKYTSIIIHELIHATRHTARLGGVDLTKPVDWYIEEVIAERATYLLLGRKFNKAYLNRHVLNRDLTSEEWAKVERQAKRSMRWIKQNIPGLR